jgi:hypothetical protein
MTSLNTIAYAFYNCGCLKTITLPANQTLVTSASNAFYNCYSLDTITNIGTLGRTTNTTDGTNMFGYNELTSISSGAFYSKFVAIRLNKVTSIRLTNASSTFGGSSPQVDVRYNSLDATALNTLFGDLPTLTGKTIAITGCSGVAGCDTSIATAKGWTVTT